MVTHILIPAHNEEATIGHVIDALIAPGWTNILVVNDASTDNTVEVAKIHGASILNSLGKRGQGAALQAGFEYLRSHIGADIIVTFDADGQHRASDVASLIQPLVDKSADITLGSRFLTERSPTIPFTRILMLKCAVLFTRLMSGLPVTDTHCGLRALNYRAYASVELSHPGMAHASEFFDIIKSKQLRWQEVSVSVEYTKYTLAKGQKAYKAFPIAWRYIFEKMKAHGE